MPLSDRIHWHIVSYACFQKKFKYNHAPRELINEDKVFPILMGYFII